MASLGPAPVGINRLENEDEGEPAVYFDVDSHGVRCLPAAPPSAPSLCSALCSPTDAGATRQVCLITLNKGRGMNGADPEILTGWMDAYDRAQADDAVKVIVVTGRGR